VVVSLSLLVSVIDITIIKTSKQMHVCSVSCLIGLYVFKTLDGKLSVQTFGRCSRVNQMLVRHRKLYAGVTERKHEQSPEAERSC
jgi:hypothetical protein